MSGNENGHWPDDIDLDRMQATSRSNSGGWLVVALIAVLIIVIPPTVNAAGAAIADARQGVDKVEHHLAQMLPRFAERKHPC
jgi:hypothetical protein